MQTLSGHRNDDPIPRRLRRRRLQWRAAAFWASLLLIVTAGAYLNARFGCAGQTCAGRWCEVSR